MTIGFEHYLILSALLFVIGATGVLLRRNVLVILLSIEIMINAANLAAVAVGYYHSMMDAQVLALFIMALAAAEVGVALAIVLLVYRRRGTITADEIDLLGQ